MSQAEDEIRALIDERIEAIRDKDPARAIATLADDVVAFELLPPLRMGADAVRNVNVFGLWLSGFETLDVGVRDLTIEADGNVGFAHALHHLVAKRMDGRSVSMWMRSTLGLRRGEDGWKIAHAHTSVPFTMEGGFRAAVKLEP